MLMGAKGRKTISWQPLLILLFCLWTVLADSVVQHDHYHHHHRHHHRRRRISRQLQQCPCMQLSQLHQLSRQDVTAVRHRRSSNARSSSSSSGEAVTWPIKRVAEIEGKNWTILTLFPLLEKGKSILTKSLKWHW